MSPDATQPNAEDRSARPTGLTFYFLLSYVVMLGFALRYAGQAPLTDWSTRLFAGAVLITHTAIYLAPSALLIAVLAGILGPRRGRPLGRRRLTVLLAVAVLTTSLTNLFLLSDATLFQMYGFHANSFVWNILTTRGGLESLGLTQATIQTTILLVGGIVVLQVVLAVLARRLRRFCPLRASRRLFLVALLVFVVLDGGERIAYGISHATGKASIVLTARTFPLYLPTKCRKLARALGLPVDSAHGTPLEARATRLRYPRQAIRLDPPDRPPNLIWLVAESLRADALSPAVMPATDRFADRALRFTNHLSGGNGTRMGLFTMFYGLYGPYWFSFLTERRAPILIDTLHRLDYRMQLLTSARFSYPEFDKTLFVTVPADRMHEDSSGPSWKRDRRNTDRAIAFIRQQTPERPFFLFMFFESPHAPYQFPPECATHRPFVEDLDYARIPTDEGITLVHNRYLNSCFHLDTQLDRLLGEIETRGLLENSIVVITGDHGEEFMEKGRWGHNSEFVEEQIRVPLVLWIPGERPRRIERMTCHLDLAPTIMHRLGITNPDEEICLGHDLLANGEQAAKGDPFVVLADWNRIAYIDSRIKAVMPVSNSLLFAVKLSGRDDAPIENVDGYFDAHPDLFGRIMRGLSAFRATAGASNN